MDWLTQNAAARGIYVIFDLHDLPGGRTSSFWADTAAQSQVADLWTRIAQHFRGNADVAAFDLLNEPANAPSSQAVWNVYNKLYTSIRSVDPDHIISMEGTFGSWNWDMLPNPATFGWKNVMYQMHEYQWNQPASGVDWGTDNQVSMFNSHKPWNVPGYVGEFNDFQYNSSWSHAVSAYTTAGLNWSEWSYKAAAGDSYGGDIYNSWGIYNDGAHIAVPNLATDSASTIRADWMAVNTATGAFVLNPTLGSILKLSSTPQPFAAVSAGVYQLINLNSGMSLDNPSASMQSGTQMVQNTLSSQLDQQWRIDDAGGGYFKLTNIASGLVLTGGKRSLSAVTQAADSGGNSQRWYFRIEADGSLELVNKASDLVLNVYGESKAALAPLISYSDRNTTNEFWMLHRLDA